VWRGLQVFWQRSAAPLLRLAGLCVALSLIAYALPAITSNPFYLNDSTFMLGVIAGLACGAHERARLVQADTGAPAA
jgi:hypothetical protein